jgi:hypothetical protein
MIRGIVDFYREFSTIQSQPPKAKAARK